MEGIDEYADKGRGFVGFGLLVGGRGLMFSFEWIYFPSLFETGTRISFFFNGRTLIRELRTRCLVVILRVISATAFWVISVEPLFLAQYPGSS